MRTSKLDMAVFEILSFQRAMCLCFEIRAMIAGVAHIFGQRVLGEGVAHDVPAFGQIPSHAWSSRSAARIAGAANTKAAVPKLLKQDTLLPNFMSYPSLLSAWFFATTDFAGHFGCPYLRSLFRLGNSCRKRFQHPVQFRVTNIAQIFTQVRLVRASVMAAERRVFPGFSAHLLVALPESHLTDRAIAEKAVHPLDNLRRNMLHQRRMGTGNQQMQCSALFFAMRKAN